MFTAYYLGKAYTSTTLIPIQFGTVLDNAYAKLTIVFHCRTKCHAGKINLGLGIFTRSIPDDETPEIYGVHQDSVDSVYPLEIQ